jgi:catabolite regulation protein CreA
LTFAAAAEDVGDTDVVGPAVGADEGEVEDVEDLERTTTNSRISAARAASAVTSLRRCSERTTVYDPPTC